MALQSLGPPCLWTEPFARRIDVSGRSFKSRLYRRAANHEMSELDEVIAYVCNGCGAGVDVVLYDASDTVSGDCEHASMSP